MIIKDKILGAIEVEIYVDPESAVDSYIDTGYVIDSGRDLTFDEVYYLTDTYADLIQDYSYQNGSRNHN